MILTHQRQELGHQPTGGGADHTEARVATDRIAATRHVGRDVIHLAQDAAGPFHHLAAVLGEASALAVDEGHTQLFLQSGDVSGDVRLHCVERSSGRGEGAVVGDRDKR